MARKTKRRISYILPPATSTVGHRLGVNGLAVDVERSILYSAGRDGVICTWEVDLDLRSRDPDPTSFRPTPARQPSEPVRDATIYRHHVQAHTHWINDLVLTQSGHALCSASSDNSVKVFRPHAADGALPQPLGFHHDYVKALAVPSKHSQWIAAGGLDCQVRLWDLSGAGKVAQFPVIAEDENKEKGSIYALAANSRLLVSGGPENVVKIWDPRSNRRVRSFFGHTDNIRSVLISAESESVISASSDKTVKVWSMATGRCLSNLTMHNDSVWSLFSNRPDLAIFYSGDRSGIVAKTDIRSADEMENGLCVALCHEQDGVNKVISAGDYFWTGTANSTINRWADVDTSLAIDFPDALRSLRPSGTARNRFSMTSQNSSATQSQATHDRIPLNAVLRLSNTSLFPPLPARDRSRISIYGAARKTSTAAVFDPDLHGYTPLRDLPLETTEGSEGLIKHKMLQDRKRILTLDTAGEVMLWDIVHCKLIKSYGKRHLEEVSREIDPLPSNPEWCTVETKIGTICCVLDERHCFDAEMYFDLLPELQSLDHREDQRINFGKWVLRYLFAGVIDKVAKSNDAYISQLEKAQVSGKPNFRISLPDPEMIIPNAEDGSSAMTPTPRLPGYRPLQTPGLQIGLATPGLAMNTATAKTPSASANPGSRPSQESANPPTSDASDDYFSQQRGHNPEGDNNGAEIPMSPSEGAGVGSPLATPSSDADKSKDATASKRWRMFASRKQPKTPLVETVKNAAEAESQQAPTAEERASAEEARLLAQHEGTMQATVTKVRSEYGKVLKAGGDLKSLIAPSLPTDTPFLALPSSIIIIIQEEQPDSAGSNDIFEGTVASTARYADSILEAGPEWLGDLLFLNRLPAGLNIKKITFTLRPFDNTLPDIVNEQDTDRLNANQLLRARKILAYVAERLEPDLPAEEMSALKPEEYLELYCQDKPVPPKMTLAEVRREFGIGGDIQLLFKSNGRRDLSRQTKPGRPLSASKEDAEAAAAGTI